ncbi:MAG: uracil-DNA glycosylase [Bdellovibrionales bacterium]|nr:uracil-DNA glycosylase [Bdellovibrionales bacterium]
MSIESIEKIKMENSWKTHLKDEFSKEYMLKLRSFLGQELNSRIKIFPPCSEFFSAFNSTPFEKVKVVLVGQDPYHGAGQAHGLCFSVKPGRRIPPSLRNIFQELHEDQGCEIPQHGCLQKWADQGVLMLNAILTVREGRPGSHQGKGWEEFTDAVIALLNTKRKNLAFVLWGSYAQKKGTILDDCRHFVLRSSHPSPFSASRGFFGSRPFSKINEYLVSHGVDPVDWSLPQI